MAKSGRGGGRAVVRDEGRVSARGGDIAAASEFLPALCARSVSGSMAEEGGARRGDRGALRGRRCAGVSVPGRKQEVPEGVAGAWAEVRAGATSGEDAAD